MNSRIQPNPLMWTIPEKAHPSGKAQPNKPNNTSPGISFQESLRAELNKQPALKISAHAQRRLEERNIVLEEGAWDKISRAVDKAAAKGARESLLIYGDVALIASVNNRTVVTAMEGQALTEHVFTNIDSAVFVR